LTQETEGLRLADIAKIFADQDPAFRNFHAKIYSFIPPSRDLAVGILNAIALDRASFPNRHPAALLLGDFSEVIRTQVRTIPMREKGSNALKILFSLDHTQLPHIECLCIVSPFKVSNGGQHYEEAFEAIRFLRSLLMLFTGKLCSYTQIAEFDFDEQGKLTQPGPVFRMPLFADFFKLQDFELGQEIAERLVWQQSEFRRRFQRACNFMDSAMNQQEESFRFVSYWIALEVIAQGTDQAIRAALRAAYSYASVKVVDDKLLFDRIARRRHELVHQGDSSTLPAYQERLMQLYFWDIVLHQMNLRHRGLARLLVESGMVEDEILHLPTAAT
jgi:hypothetical protein